MVTWFQRRARSAAPRLRQRTGLRRTTRVDFAELTPDAASFLGQVAYLQLGFFQQLSSLGSASSDLGAKETLASAAGAALAKHQGCVAEIRRRGDDPAEVMAPFAPSIDRYLEVTRGESVNERLVSAYICQGFLDDFYVSLAAGLPADIGPRLAVLLGADSGASGIVSLLTDAIAADPARAHFLALWGRRLVGDTLLLAEAALRHGDGARRNGIGSDDERIEPVFTELIATHTRRMDTLGLTA
ncbi:ferritin-like fold-containing protein [Okibacterium endophyticum]